MIIEYRCKLYKNFIHERSSLSILPFYPACKETRCRDLRSRYPSDIRETFDLFTIDSRFLVFHRYRVAGYIRLARFRASTSRKPPSYPRLRSKIEENPRSLLSRRSIMSIEGKIALVTGGANGIGFCTARKLLRNGAKAVALLDLSDSGGESAAADLNNEFGKDRAVFIACDVSKSEQLKESFKKVIDTHETLDIVVNIAGIMDDADWEIMVDVNYKGVVHGTILGLHTMGKYKGGNGGTIINMSSVAGLEGIPIAPIYGGTQYAIVGFTQSLKHYYDKTGIRMLTICPGLTTTAMAARFMSTKEHAMDLLDEETAAMAMASMQKQPPEHVASAIIQLIEKGKNGAIFVIENNQPAYEVEIPGYSTLKVPI